MSKYYNAESVNDEIVRVLEQTDCKDEYIDRVLRAIESLPTIIVPKIINGVVLKDCDKVIERFLEEHECDELWETVRALRDFYDCVTEEELKGCDKADKRFSEDAISRREVCELIGSYCDDVKLATYTGVDIVTAIGNLPSVIPQPKEGEWIDTGKDPKHEHPLTARWYRCSECGHEGNTKFPWCPYCGSRMKGTEDET